MKISSLLTSWSTFLPLTLLNTVEKFQKSQKSETESNTGSPSLNARDSKLEMISTQESIDHGVNERVRIQVWSVRQEKNWSTLSQEQLRSQVCRLRRQRWSRDNSCNCANCGCRITSQQSLIRLNWPKLLHCRFWVLHKWVSLISRHRLMLTDLS